MRSHNHFSIPFLILVVSTFSHSISKFHAQGRKLSPTTTDFSPAREKEEKTIWRGEVGSRPPRCERRCGGCGHCEAIQVPTSPRINSKPTTTTTSTDHDEFDSNYKPLSWKCKCGNLIFNP